MPLQQILEECVAVQRHLREPELDLDFLVAHAEALVRNAHMARDGATYVHTSDNDRKRIREAFLGKTRTLVTN